MPEPKATAPKALIQKFAIATHIHDLPVCTSTKHSRTCKTHGIWLGCRKSYRVIRVPGPDGRPRKQLEHFAVCMHFVR